MLWHQYREHQPHSLAIGGFKWNPVFCANENSKCIAQAFDATVRDGDTMPEASRPKFFTRKQGVKNGGTRNLVLVFEQESNLLKQPLFAGDVEVEQNVGDGKKLGESCEWHGTRSALVRCGILRRDQSAGSADQYLDCGVLDELVEFLDVDPIL
jgi:hypothetical protein